MHTGIQVQEGKQRKIQWFIANEKGQVLVEAAMSFIILALLTVAIIEAVFLIQDRIYITRIARDAARGAIIEGCNLGTGMKIAQDRATMYFGSNSGKVSTSMAKHTENSVRCEISYLHTTMFGVDVPISAHAVFGFKSLDP